MSSPEWRRRHARRGLRDSIAWAVIVGTLLAVGIAMAVITLTGPG